MSFGATAGDVRAHGSKGAYVSDLTIDKANLSVISGKDFLASANDLFLASADGTTWTSGTTTAFSALLLGRPGRRHRLPQRHQRLRRSHLPHRRGSRS